MSIRSFSSSLRAFTLIELLVVVGIIAVLISILLPALSRVRVQARQTASASNMRQLGLAIHMYCDNNAGHFPASDHEGNPLDSWLYKLQPYLGRSTAEHEKLLEGLRINPADPLADGRRENGQSSYVLSEYMIEPVEDAAGSVVADYTRMARVQKPAEVMLMFESGKPLDDDHADHAHSIDWFEPGLSVDERWGEVLHDVAVDLYNGRNEQRTKGQANYLFVDGHVVPIRARQLRDWLETGVNFAAPSIGMMP